MTNEPTRPSTADGTAERYRSGPTTRGSTALRGLVAFAVYAADHVADAEGDVGATPSRARLALRYGDQLMTAAAVSYGLALALAVGAGPGALAFAGVALLALGW